jgi:hypothetical protein
MDVRINQEFLLQGVPLVTLNINQHLTIPCKQGDLQWCSY